MKLATIVIATALLFVGCKSKEDSQNVTKISSQKLCQTVDLATAQKLVGKKLHTDSKEEHKFPYATTCSVENKDGYPYFTITLFYNSKNKEPQYFAPPDSVFNSYKKKIAKDTIAVVSKDDKNTLEVLKKGSNNWVVAVTPLNVKAIDGSINQTQLIKIVDSVLFGLQK